MREGVSVQKSEKKGLKMVYNYNELFGNVDDLDETYDYSINNNAFYNIEAYKNI